MSFTHYPLGHRTRGETVEIVLKGSAANVRLLDSGNLNAYKAGRQHRYHGGLAKRSPVHLTIPSTGTWHVVVDMQGLRGTVNSSARVMPGPLPELRARPAAPLAQIVDDAAAYRSEHSLVDPDHDVFISHASEDKADFVDALAAELRDLGVKVWYDAVALRPGDSLRRSIDKGILGSKIGLVVLSPAFFSKQWPQYELDGLVTLSVGGKQKLIPVWHNVGHAEVMGYSPALADKVALRSGDLDVAEIARQIAELVVGAP